MTILPGRAEDAVAGVGEPLPVAAGLRAVLGDREAGEFAAVGAELRDPADHRDREHRLRAGRLAGGDERVAALAGVALLSPMLSKYQSLPRLSAFSCQL